MRNLVFIICSLLIGIDCVTDKLKVTFSRMKKHAFVLKFSPQNAENHIFRALKFQNFLGWNALRPPPPQQPLVDIVGYTIQTAGYFNFY